MDAIGVQSVQVRWPASGKVVQYAGRLNSMNVLDEGEEGK